MPRPKRATGDQKQFTLRFTAEERLLVDKLVEARAKELRELAGGSVEVTPTSLLRWLIEREAEARGFAKRKK